eukprot:COSAG01_NODE_30820_length_609_cov_0.700000_1_plen_167_part_10
MRLDTALPPVSRPPPASTHHLFDHLGKLVTFHVFKTSAFEGPKFGDGGFFSSPSFGRPVLKFRAGGGAERLGGACGRARQAGTPRNMPRRDKGGTISCPVCAALGVTGEDLRHRVDTCPNRGADYVARPTRCSRCGEPGHNVRRCPQPRGYVRPAPAAGAPTASQSI